MDQKPHTTKVLFAVKIGDPDWQEQLITEQAAHIENAKAWARENGFDRFRVATVDLTQPPDFVGTING